MWSVDGGCCTSLVAGRVRGRDPAQPDCGHDSEPASTNLSLVSLLLPAAISIGWLSLRIAGPGKLDLFITWP
jgi:hypothetical protein